MAASGINEHNEACRKQNFMNRQAYRKWLYLEKYGGTTCDESPPLLLENVKTGRSSEQLKPRHSYHRENLGRQQEPVGVNQKIGQASRYSAKLRGRFTSTNYSQQW